MAQMSAREAREVAQFDRQREKRIRRTAPVTLGILIALLLAVGVTAVIDLRRLNTPGGTALSWAEAATFGECDRYTELSVSPPGVAESRTSGQVCDALRQRTEAARQQQTGIVVRLLGSRDGEATIAIERGGAQAVRAEVNLVKRDGRWRVLLDPDVCVPIGCA